MSIGGKSKPVSDGGAAKIRDSAAKVGDEAGRAALDTASDTSDFVDEFFNKYIDPAINQVRLATEDAQASNKAMLEQQQSLAGTAKGLYDTEGVAAQKKFFKEAADYDPEADAERANQAAFGDVNAQYENAQAQSDRALAARGINPTSGAGAFNQQNFMLQSALTKAKMAAVNRATALATGRQYTANAANAGAGLGQAAGQAVNAQGATIGQGAGLPIAQLGAQTEALKPVTAGYLGVGGIQSDMYKSSLGGQTAAASNITQASIQDSKNAAEAGSGIGKLAGIALKAGLSYAFPPAAALPVG